MGKLRAKAEKNAISELQKDVPDVLFLQEVGHSDRPFLQKMTETNQYVTEFFKNPKDYDCAIALNKERFQLENSYSLEISFGDRKKDCAICVAEDKITHKRYLFVSAHIPGFNYTISGSELASQAADGDAFCEALLSEINNIKQKQKKNGSPINQVIIGADVNASPEKWKRRFKLFKEEGLEVKRTASPTNVHFMDKTDQVREIDYFFTSPEKRSFWKKVNQFFTGGDRIEVQARSFSRFGFDKENNMSDHKPIVGEVKVITQKSVTQRLSERFNRFWG